MQIRLTVSRQEYLINPDYGHCISIMQTFDERQPNHFGAAPASSIPLTISGFTGDVKAGGSCNVDRIAIIPHCNGTHTECAGHVLQNKLCVGDVLTELFIPATLISISPQSSSSATDTYDPPLSDQDSIITAEQLKTALQKASDGFVEALVVRTLPNLTDKCSRNYQQTGAPFFSLEAIDYIHALGVRHLLVDLPSIDRMQDDGKLCNHRRYWDIPRGAIRVENPSQKTISEMIYVPDCVMDGQYLLHIQIPDWQSDAVPSRIWLYGIQ